MNVPGSEKSYLPRFEYAFIYNFHEGLSFQLLLKRFVPVLSISVYLSALETRDEVETWRGHKGVE